MAIQDLLGRPHLGGELRLLVLTSVSTCRGAFDTLGETLATARDLRMRRAAFEETLLLLGGENIARDTPRSGKGRWASWGGDGERVDHGIMW